jgi:hypothetical protein
VTTMILSFMQPYFFPYLGYFDLINRSDVWFVFDVVKYKNRQWMNRNRVMHPVSGWQYITVPIDRQTRGGTIQDVRIRDKAAARRRILGQLEHYRIKRAPYFRKTVELVGECFDGTDSDRMRDLAVGSLAVSCGYLGIRFEPQIFSEADIELPEITHRGQWAVELSAAVGASDYLNAPGARTLNIHRPDEFADRGIRLHYAEPNDFEYSCGGGEFMADLSIVDVLMWNAPETVKAHLDGIKDRWLGQADMARGSMPVAGGEAP